MPSKRTSDSVDRILQDLNREQTAAGVRDSVTDHQVDEILRSVGITAAPQSTAPMQGGFAFAELEDEWTAPPRQAPAQTAPAARAAAPAQQTPAPAVQQTPAQQTPAAPAPRPEPQQTSATLGDTTRTGIIKNFLLKMGGSAADTDALNQGKNQFQKFFKDSVAVVPDANGKIREPKRKKRGLFGLKSAEDTDEFVPINVSLGTRREDAPAQQTPQPEQREYFPDRPQPQPEPAPAAPQKRGLLDGLFGAAPQPEEDDFYTEYGAPDTPDTPDDRPAPAPETEEDTAAYEAAPARRSKYTRPAEPDATLSGDTLSMLRSTVRSAQSGQDAQRPAAPKESTVYRKKRNTVEYIPGQKLNAAPVQAAPAPVPEPVGETYDNSPATGFTMQIGAADAMPIDSTRDFLSAYNAVRPRPAPRVQPAPSGQGIEGGYVPRPRDEVDDLVDRTLTGQIKLDLGAAAQTAQAAPAQTPAHSGFTQSVSGAPQTAAPQTSAFVSDIARAINDGSVKSGDDAYARAAARLTSDPNTEWEDEDEADAPAPRARTRLGGRPADETPDGAAAPFETAALPRLHRDFERTEDAPAVRAELNARAVRLGATAAVTGILAAVLLALGILAAVPALPAFLTEPYVLPAVALLLLMVACGLNAPVFLRGFTGLVRVPTADSIAVLPALGALVQLVAYLLQGDAYDPTAGALMTGPAVLVLCFNAAGRAMDARSARDGFALVGADVDHAVAYRLKDAGALNAVSVGLVEPHPCVLVSRPTQILKGFLSAADARRTSDKNQQQFARLAAGCALAAAVFVLIREKDFAAAATALAGVLCLGAPLAGTLVSALPARLMQRSAAQVGAVVPGWRDIRQLGRINVLQVTAKDLFPNGCVTLCGIKPVHPEHIDLAIVYAASVLAEAGPTLRGVFLNMLGENRSLQAEVTDRRTIYGKGYSGWVNKRRVLVGNRALMTDYGVKIPSLEYEQQHTVNQRRVIYLAVSGKLFAMFQLAYQRDPDTAAVLNSLRRGGLSLAVDCDDFNCDAALLETAYSLPSGAVKVLTGSERDALARSTAWLPESEGNMLHLGSFASLVGGLEAAAAAAEGERRASMVFAAAVLFGCALGVLLTLTGGLSTLPLPAVLLYQAVWAVLTLAFPLMQHY